MKRLLNFLDNYLFLIFLFFIFFLEGIGYLYNTKTSYYLAVIMPFFLFSIDVLKNRKIIVSKKVFILFVSIFVFSFISVLFSTGVQNSFENLLFLISIFLTFVYVYNHKNEISGKIENLLIFLGVIYIIFPPLASKLGIVLISNFRNFGQFVEGNVHGTLGDFLGMILLILLQRWLFKNRKLYILILIFFFYFFIVSFSRTAYFAFFLIGGILLLRNNKLLNTKIFLVLPLLFISLLFFLTISKEARNLGWPNGFYQFFEKTYSYRDKDFLSDRNYYFEWAIRGVKERPWVGVGLGNFMNLSTKYSQKPLSNSVSSKNIFLDYFSEGGIFVGILFILMIFYILIRCNFNPLIFYLLLSFQTFWLHRFYSVLLLFFTLLALYMKKKEKLFFIIESGKVVLVSFFLLIISLLILSSTIFSEMSKYRIAFLLYPLNQQAVFGLAQQELDNGHKDKALRYVDWSVKLSSVCSYCGDLYLKIGDKQKALQIFLQAYSWNPYTTEKNYSEFPWGQKLIIRKIYELEKQLYGDGKAKQFFDSYMRILQKSIPNQFHSSPLVYDDGKVMCDTIYKKKGCPYKF